MLAWVLGYVSENDAQAFNQGLYYLQRENNPEPFARKQKTRDGYNFYEALKKQSINFVGLVGSCVDIVGGDACSGGMLCAMREIADCLQNICLTKTSSLQNLCSHTIERQPRV